MSNLQDMFDDNSSHKFKISNRKGKHQSQSARKKISEAAKGRKHSIETIMYMKSTRYNNVKIMTPIGEFCSISEAARVYNVGGEVMRYWINKSKCSQFYRITECQ